MRGGKPLSEWIADYSRSHQHPVNQRCHAVGIPTVTLSILLLAVSSLISGLWPVAIALFVVGWALQFIGHAVEGKPPEFLRDPRFLLVGLRWWIAKVRPWRVRQRSIDDDAVP